MPLTVMGRGRLVAHEAAWNKTVRLDYWTGGVLLHRLRLECEFHCGGFVDSGQHHEDVRGAQVQ